MKWEYNEPHTTNLHSPVEYTTQHTNYQDRQCLSLLVVHNLVFVSNSNQTWRNSMGIWRNIGKIVILVFQIVHEQIKWTIRSYSKKSYIKERDTTKKSNIPSSELNNIQHSGVGSNYEPLSEEQESKERSKLMVELCEMPYYKNDQFRVHMD